MKRSNDTDDTRIKELFQKSGMDKPSPDFTDRVMNTVLSQPDLQKGSMKPVIGKFGWIFIFSIVGLLGLLVLLINPFQTGWFPTIHFTNFEIPELFSRDSGDLFGDLIHFERPSLIYFAVFALITLICCDYLIHKFQDKGNLGIL
jgi:hypothetical protein